MLFAAACASHASRTVEAAPEPWFQKIRGVSEVEKVTCKQLGFVETDVEAANHVPAIPREDYRNTRRAAFSDFEEKVLEAGGNAVRIIVFREQGAAGPFALDGIQLKGYALRCP